MTASDIASGGGNLPAWCPVAQAIRRTTGIYAEVYSSRILLYIDGLNRKPLRLPIATEVRRWIEEYDRNPDRRCMGAFDFELAIPLT